MRSALVGVYFASLKASQANHHEKLPRRQSEQCQAASQPAAQQLAENVAEAQNISKKGEKKKKKNKKFHEKKFHLFSL